ncbi:MAG: hypothetical protein IPH60_08475 [Flavobacteriales bacterium]|nr:hypothetical protein [Flavobacteriales bacterium]
MASRNSCGCSFIAAKVPNINWKVAFTRSAYGFNMCASLIRATRPRKALYPVLYRGPSMKPVSPSSGVCFTVSK